MSEFARRVIRLESRGRLESTFALRLLDTAHDVARQIAQLRRTLGPAAPQRSSR